MRAFVATGGKSRRFGFQKCMYTFTNGMRMMDLAVKNLYGLFDEIVQVGKKIRDDLPFMEDLYPDSGPMGVILTVFDRTDEDHFFLFGCDMPFIMADVVKLLMDHHERSRKCVTVELYGKIQTLHSIYDRVIYDELKRSFNSGNRAVWRVMRKSKNVLILSDEDFEGIDNWRMSFTNLNEMGDMMDVPG